MVSYFEQMHWHGPTSSVNVEYAHYGTHVITHIVLHLDKHNSKDRGAGANRDRSALSLMGPNIILIFGAKRQE
jgi:hypothetical protein